MHVGSWWRTPDGKIPPERPTRGLVDNIKIVIIETGWDGMDFVDLVEVRDH